MRLKCSIAILLGLLLAVVGWIVVYASQPAGLLGGPHLKSARSLAVACRSFAGDHDGRYPKDFGELSEDIPDAGLSRLMKPGRGIEYRYRAGLTDDSPLDAIVFYSVEPVRFSRHYVARLDCSGAFVSREETSRELGAGGERAAGRPKESEGTVPFP